MTYPICSRCASKFIVCEYKGDKGAFKAVEAAESSSAFNSESVPDLLSITDQTMLLEETTPFPGELQLDNAIDDSFFEAFDNRQLQDNAQYFSNLFPTVGVMDRERIMFIVKQLRSYPEKLFRNGRTAFIHPQAYQPAMSPVLQDACCAAALYSGKNEKNEAIVWDIISTKANQLLEPRASWTVSEHLSHLQALIVFQILQIFDGDIRQRAEAEQHEDTLTQWTDRLLQRTGVNVSAGNVIPSSWESWVFEEVVCRTIVISRMVQAMFSILKHGFCTLVGAVTEMSFTAQKALWEAPSAQHFQKACSEKNRFYALRMNLDEILSSATIDDMDDMGMLMLTTYKGVDGVNEWIMRSGCTALIE
jgi:hypothetical protein